MKRVLVLFPKDWDRAALSHARYAGRYEFVFEGFDIFRFPENARLLAFDVRRFIDALAAKYRGRVEGVVSNNEYFGALTAAVLARRLGLHGTDPKAVVTAQHKYYSRLVQRACVPEAVPAFSAFSYEVRAPSEVGLDFPCFVKAVKATFSVLARRVENFEELKAHLDLKRFEKFLIRRLMKPYNVLAPDYADIPLDACNMIAEEIVEGVQVNVDGFVRDGMVTLLGAIDEVMYPGTSAFMRFEYPSRLPADVQSRIGAITKRVLTALGYDYGFFNIEFIYDPATGALRVIELNPRLASQLSSLYRSVDGYDPHEALLQLATGEAPEIRRGAGEFRSAGSFIFRRFDGRAVAAAPSAAQVQSALAAYPDARLMLYLKRGAALAREMKWLGSYRYAVLNLAGTSRDDLHQRFNAIRRSLALE